MAGTWLCRNHQPPAASVLARDPRLSGSIYKQVEGSRYRHRTWMRMLLAWCRRFSKLGCIHENVPGPRIVRHRLRPKFRLHFSRFTEVIRRVLVKDMYEPLARRNEHKPGFRIVDLGISTIADRE